MVVEAYLEDTHLAHASLEVYMNPDEAGDLLAPHHVPVLLGMVVVAVGGLHEPRGRLDADTLLPIPQPTPGVDVELVLRHNPGGNHNKYITIPHREEDETEIRPQREREREREGRRGGRDSA